MVVIILPQLLHNSQEHFLAVTLLEGEPLVLAAYLDSLLYNYCKLQIFAMRPTGLSATHLGHELHESGAMDHDITVKRAEFINKSTEIRETFSFASPVEVLRSLKVFAGDMYGSNLWQLCGGMANQVYHAWDTNIKLAWGVPSGTHTYFVDRMLGCGISHVRSDIMSRYIKFFKSLRESPSVEVSVVVNIVARDIRTTTGNNLQLIRDLSGLDPWCCTSKQMKTVLMDRVTEVPDLDQWRVSYLGKLLEQRGELHTSQLTKLIDSICVN